MRVALGITAGVMLSMALLYALAPAEGMELSTSAALDTVGIVGATLSAVLLTNVVSRGRGGMTITSMLAEPRRGLLLRARLGLAALICVGVAVFGVLLVALVTAPLTNLSDRSLNFSWADPMVFGVRVMALSGLAVACGLLIPSPGVAFGVFIAISLFGDLVIAPLGEMGQWLSLGRSLDSLTVPLVNSPWPLLSAITFWVAVPMVAGCWMFVRADVSFGD